VRNFFHNDGRRLVGSENGHNSLHDLAWEKLNMKREERMKKASIAIFSALALVFSTLTATHSLAAAPEAIQLKVQTSFGATYPSRIAVENMMKKLTSTGRFKFKYYAQQSLIPAKEVADGLRKGVLDFSESAVGYHKDRFGLIAEVQWMPRNFNFDKFTAHYRDKGGWLDFNEPYFDKLGLKLMIDFHTPSSVLCSTKPVKSMADLKGLMVRDTGTMTPWFKLLGMTPVNISPNELYEGFQRGMVQGHLTSTSAYMSNKWYEVAKYIADFQWFLAGTTFMMNKKVYDSFPADAKAIFDKAVLEAEAEMFKLAKEQDANDVKAMTAKGAIISTPSPADQEKLDSTIQPYFDSLAQKYGKEWTDFVRIQKTLK
jgi:TRAP-type C4-dicarboxylate transport system substrate-binding protein